MNTQNKIQSYNFSNESKDTVEHTTGQCFHCGIISVITLDSKDHDDWRGGRLIQDAFPYLDVDKREQIISGTHPECWEAMFK